MALLFFAGTAMLLASAAVSVSAAAAEPDLEGLWQTPGETPTILRFTQVNGEYRGVIDSIPAAQGEDADLRCTECTGSRRNQPLLNMEIVWGLKRQGREYTGGSVLDPETGAIYRCALTIAPDGQQLRVRYSAEPPLKSMSEIWTRQTRPAASTRDDATSRKAARAARHQGILVFVRRGAGLLREQAYR